jgi:hypothetical protein
MTDKELLELAAKAAGIELKWISEKSYIGSPVSAHWNPIDFDGDALRLAVKLMLDIYCHERGAHVDGDRREYHAEESGDDQYAATRRAIVRAAAELGKAMK